MNSTDILTEQQAHSISDTFLSKLREEKGLTQEFVANKLHLRQQVISLLEEGRYDLLPDSVFVKGYLRSYAKLLEVDPEPLIKQYTQNHEVEKKIEKPLWLMKREDRSGEKMIRFTTAILALTLATIMSIWWQKSNHQQLKGSNHENVAKQAGHQVMTEVELAQLNHLKSSLPQTTSPRKTRG